MKIMEIEAGCREILAELSRIIVGKEDVLRQLLAGILANGHILIEDYPGLAKTLIARLFSEAMAHQLDVKSPGEKLLELSQHRRGRLALAFGEEMPDRAARPSQTRASSKKAGVTWRDTSAELSEPA